jgi:hypothetical protein
MKSLEYYRLILGIDAGATAEQVRQAYIDLVKRWHPDQFAHDPALQQAAEAKLKEINEAYKELQSGLDSFHSRVVHPQAEPAAAPKTNAEQPTVKKPSAHRSGAQRGSDAVYQKRRRWMRKLAVRLFIVALGLLSLFLASYAIVKHMDPERAPTYSGAAVPPSVQSPVSNNADADLERAKLVEEMKKSYDGTLKLLVQHEEEKARLNVEYVRRRELYLRNMISREELAAAERALAQATAKIAEDRQWLTKAEMAIGAAALARENLKGTEAQK